MKFDKIGKYYLISGIYKMRRTGRIKHQEKC
jgi:hypothetical protein